MEIFKYILIIFLTLLMADKVRLEHEQDDKFWTVVVFATMMGLSVILL